MKIWSCKIGECDEGLLELGADAPMRKAVQKAYGEVTGLDADFCFSGWGAELDEFERAVADDTEPQLKVTDKQRLDYLEENPSAFGHNVENGGWGFEFESPYFSTFRECIDHQILNETTSLEE